MGNDVKTVVVFIVIVAVICIVWNHLMMKFERIEKEDKISKTKVSKLKFNSCISDNKKLELMGIKPDGNSDYEVEKAIKKVALEENARIKINE